MFDNERASKGLFSLLAAKFEQQTPKLIYGPSLISTSMCLHQHTEVELTKFTPEKNSREMPFPDSLKAASMVL